MWYGQLAISDVGEILLAEQRCQAEWTLAQGRGINTLMNWSAAGAALTVTRHDLLTAEISDGLQSVMLTGDCNTLDRLEHAAMTQGAQVGTRSTSFGRTLWFDTPAGKIRLANWQAWR